MSLIDTAEDMLHLTAAEKAVVSAALPTFATWLHLLNAQWGTLEDAIGWLANSKPVALRLIADGKQIGPIAEDIVTDKANIFEASGAMGPVNDAKAVLAANPKLIAALQSDYKKLAPLISQVEGDFKKPEIQAAWELLQAKMNTHNVSLHMLASALINKAAVQPNTDSRGGLGADAQIIKGQK